MAPEYYSCVLHGSAVASSEIYAAVMASAAKSISVIKVHVNTHGSTPTHLGLARAYTVGTATSIATGLPHRELAPAATARGEKAWSLSPTGTGLSFAHRFIKGTQGEELVLWSMTDDAPIVVEPSGALLVINAGTGVGAELAIEFTWREGPI